MGLRVRVGAGTGIEVLVAAAAVADSDWRSVFTHGESATAAARTAGGTALTQATARFGRFGWINLVGPLTARRAPWSDEALVTLVGEMPAEDLHAALVGVRRHELRKHVDEATIRAALGGDRSASRLLKDALARTVVQVSPWLLRTDAESVKRVCLATLSQLPSTLTRSPSSAATRARLAEAGAEKVIEEVAPGVHYGPDVLDHVVLVTSPQVAPILVVVDEVDRTVILHPPLGEQGATDAGAQLRDLGRAVGDATRLRLLHELRTGTRTLAQLCAALDSPRTTLLHHLALLRAAGLIEIDVVDAEPNVYALRLEGFDTLAQAARAFPLRS